MCQRKWRADDYPDKRLIVCHNPLLEASRQKRCEELLVATEKTLKELSQQIARQNEKSKPLTGAQIGIRVGRIVNKDHVAKHFETTIYFKHKTKIRSAISKGDFR
ncbi:MAG: hypothetical protein LBJ67_09595 [Planctomycetaceae bacterium]|jgi:hypothetical protein|nr:hypothetical protein [Planctomycetaceae bacterium]